MLALRRALMDSTWEEILDGCKNYARFCEEGGTTGSAFVQAPLRFIQDQSYLETFEYKAAQSKDELARSELRSRDLLRMQKAIEAGARIDSSLRPVPGECAAAFETRVMLAGTVGRNALRSEQICVNRDTSNGGQLHSDISDLERSGESIRGRISSLADRMRIAK